jgi:hypothetical protein
MSFKMSPLRNGILLFIHFFVIRLPGGWFVFVIAFKVVMMLSSTAFLTLPLPGALEEAGPK